MELIQEGLKRFNSEFIGIKLLEISIKSKSGGFGFGKLLQNNLLVIAPGNAEIQHKEQGQIAINIENFAIN